MSVETRWCDGAIWTRRAPSRHHNDRTTGEGSLALTAMIATTAGEHTGAVGRGRGG